jgi:hypothetical protein
MYPFVIISIGTNLVYFIPPISFPNWCVDPPKLCLPMCHLSTIKPANMRKFCVRFGIFNPAIVYDHLGEIYSALVFGSFVFCIFLYIKVSFVKKQLCFPESLGTRCFISLTFSFPF